MSDRGQRGTRGRGGGYDRTGRGAPHHGRGGASGGGASQHQTEKPKKENILDLSKYMDKEVHVKFNGGREGKYTMNKLTPLYAP